MAFLNKTFWNIVTIAVLATTIVAAVSIEAATLTQANDYPGTLQTSQTANHHLIFTTSSGVAEGESLTVEFASEFNTASLTEDDVDLEDDSTDLTTAPDCSGTEQASVTIVADVLTFTICSGDSGAIAAGSEVAVKIGTNATASGTGVNHAVNPDNVGTYFVSIAGSFGDSGSIALPIGSDDSISVSANVTTGGGGGGGGEPPPPADSTPPIISNVLVSGITKNSAVINWTTNESADSQVAYGLTTSYEVGTQTNFSFVYTHALTLSGLSEGTQYHFQIRSQDLAANQATAGDYTFTTLDQTAPVISNLQVVDLTTTSARVTWTTNELADSTIDYGPTVAYGSLLSEPTLVTEHSLILTGLNHTSTYHYRVKSKDASLNQAVSTDQTFATLANPAPANVIGLTVTPGNAQNVLSWTNPPDTDLSAVKVIVCTNEAPSSPNDPDCTQVFNALGTGFTQSGLTNGVTYYYGVFAYDTLNQYASGALGNGKPMAPDLPPGNITGLNLNPGNAQNALSWTNPADADLAGIRIIACPDGFPTGPLDPACDVLSENTRTAFTHASLTNGRTYYYGLYSYDLSGQFASGVLGSGKPSAPEEELPPGEEGEEDIPPPVSTDTGYCGNGICSDFESPATCPSDCGQPELPPKGPICGDAVCQIDENNQSCPDDCTSDMPSTALLRDNLELFVATGAIKLVPNNSGAVRILNGRPIFVQLLRRSLTKSVDRVQLSLGQETFLMAPNFREEGAGDNNLQAASVGDDAYAVSLISPDEPASYPVTVTLFYDDHSSQSVPLIFDVQGSGYLFSWFEGATQRLSGAQVTLFQSPGSLVTWDGSPYGQFNPVNSEADGTFAWYVPNGNYVVRADTSGYLSVDTAVTVVDNIVNPAIQMSAILLEELPPEVLEEQEELVPSPLQNFSESVQEATQQAVDDVEAALDAIRAVPGVQEAADISVPVLAVSAATSGLILGISFNFLPFLQYLFTAPILFIGRRRRRGFGVIYNSISKTPIDLAIVRLYQLAEGIADPSQGRLVRSRVTDKGGRYFFLVQPGHYRLSVTKNGFTFPSDYLKDEKQDADFLDVYHGEVIEVTDKDAVIAANVPVDPSQAEQFTKPSKIVWKNRLRSFQNVIAVSGLIASVVFAIIQPSWLTVAMIFVQALVYLLARRLATAAKPQSWGIVYDGVTKQPLSHVIARIFEPKYNKLLETRVTDNQGRFSFLLGPNEYYAVFEKTGYATTEIRPIDYSVNKEPVEFAQKINLSPAAK
ncbi:fibronectin type III domain-containing protein [Patescibacteria group bacterium]|nr:fibronectin type III domain-containing protein [Patescibacteria group bacterium]MBU1705781.1 fibronectin type III domain-containing protein [Patescibacteria group bacterium]